MQKRVHFSEVKWMFVVLMLFKFLSRVLAVGISLFLGRRGKGPCIAHYHEEIGGPQQHLGAKRLLP